MKKPLIKEHLKEYLDILANAQFSVMGKVAGHDRWFAEVIKKLNSIKNTFIMDIEC